LCLKVGGAMRVTVCMVVVRGLVPVVVLVPMVVQLGLIEQKEKYQCAQERSAQGVCAHLALKGLGQQVHKGRSQQGPRSQTKQLLRKTRQHTKGQGRSQPHAAHAGKQSSD
jgi:hypothetical protein